MLEEIVEYLRFKQEVWISQDVDTPHITTAIEELHAGHPERAIGLLEDDLHHFQVVAAENPNFLSGGEESLSRKRFWIEEAEYEVKRLDAWLQFLEQR